MSPAPPPSSHPLHDLAARLNPPAAPAAAPQSRPHPAAQGLTREEMEAQLLTLERYAEAASKARALGGPARGLAALLRQPLACGPFVLYPLTASVFLFLRAVKSPLVGESVERPLEVQDLTVALLAFTGPEKAAGFLKFTAAGAEADMAAVHQEAWKIATCLNSKELAAAAEWLACQISDVAGLVPNETEEETGNFQGPPAETTASPEAAPQPPAPPAGSL